MKEERILRHWALLTARCEELFIRARAGEVYEVADELGGLSIETTFQIEGYAPGVLMLAIAKKVIPEYYEYQVDGLLCDYPRLTLLAYNEKRGLE